MLLNRFVRVEYLLMTVTMPLLHFVDDDAVDLLVSDLDDEALLVRVVVEAEKGHERRALNEGLLLFIIEVDIEGRWENFKPERDMIFGFK